MSGPLVPTAAVAVVTAVAVVAAMTAAPAAAAPADAGHTATARVAARTDDSGAPTYRVYATREGLVGHTTANGHRIRKNDHFVALPSRLALSEKGEGARSVRVCAPSTSRCEYAPVWDVGPWNIKDNYWNSARHRERFADLPRGVPQAHAAYYDGHNGGKDGFGRQVRNPAGIDLADGTFYDGLGLTGNAWVDVTFLWLGDGPTGTIRTGTHRPLNVRSGPGTSYARSGLAAAGTRVTIRCTVWGEWVDGHLGSTPLWNKIGPGHFVSDAYTRTGTGRPVAPPC
ncbi:hypothetical protein IHE71_02185 [Myceligenerans sp. TRM 65318]|uniref:SH3 domain-containing protein n=2 Tax=Myceligenerans pegani TaxID=2776917 RepID=A0ABR9MT03_9MICO|nr:hypothetical protein [Myceligenerans sp. TRM 65318]MBE3016784.1 hypothetical protein [Myceligenerans sp. TRM 65318]